MRTSFHSSGADRDRTDDLFHAMEALSQLSYGPRDPTSGCKLARPEVCERRKVSERPPTGKPSGVETLERAPDGFIIREALGPCPNQPSSSSIAPAKTSLP